MESGLNLQNTARRGSPKTNAAGVASRHAVLAVRLSRPGYRGWTVADPFAEPVAETCAPLGLADAPPDAEAPAPALTSGFAASAVDFTSAAFAFAAPATPCAVAWA
jgi:hypothetical protein